VEVNNILLVTPAAFTRAFSIVIKALNTIHYVSEAGEEGRTLFLKHTVLLGVFLGQWKKFL
jgi:hypothetical protein